MNNDDSNRNYPVDNPTRIQRQFDGIAYDKAGSIMLMIRELIGEPLWNQGIQLIISGHLYESYNMTMSSSY